MNSINLFVREATLMERLYAYTQSTQIMSQTGCIGHLRADMDSNGKGFFVSWFDHRGYLKTDEFKAEFDDVINSLRFNSEYGDVLKDRSSLMCYCYAHPAASFGNDREFGFRADTDKYAYILRLNPNRGEYNLYCYCYRKDWLENHLRNAARGIRFIDSSYNVKFKLMDGGSIQITNTEDGTVRTSVCRYIDDYHVEIGSTLYHICEFAERMEQSHATVKPTKSEDVIRASENDNLSKETKIMAGYYARFNKAGNIKIGRIWSFNKLAGAGMIGGCMGTCGKYCTGCYNANDPYHSLCYVFKSYLRYGKENSSVVKGHIRNTKAINENLISAFEDLRGQIKRARNKPNAVRIHSSGEIQTMEELKHWVTTAAMFPDIPFYVYTKAYDIVDEFFKRRFTLPENFFLNISIWHDVGTECYNRWKGKRNVRAFIYDDGYDYSKHGIEVKFHCPAYDAKGKMDHRFTCDKCKVCFSSRNKVCACFDH